MIEVHRTNGKLVKKILNDCLTMGFILPICINIAHKTNRNMQIFFT